MKTRGWSSWLLSLLCVACVAPRDDLAGLAEQPPLDLAVLVTGGAFLSSSLEGSGTFASAAAADGAVRAEAIPIEAVLEVLQRGRIFQRVELDGDADRRRLIAAQMREHRSAAGTLAFLQEARTAGFDLVLVVEELQDGPIDRQGTNGRWPVTFATWILLGVGMFIPDRTFESRASLRVTLRDLQTGEVLLDSLPVAGPIELALTERTDWFGLVKSIVVPPFWVGDDDEAVVDSVRTTTQRRLLLSLARELKASGRQRLRERAVASLQLVPDDQTGRIVVESLAGVAVVRLRGEQVEPGDAEAFAQRLLGSMVRDGARYRYEAPLPRLAPGNSIQVLVGTLPGGVASATFMPAGAR